MSPKCGLLQRSYPKVSLQTARRRDEAKICVPGFRSRTRHIHAFGFYYTGGTSNECQRYHSRLAELISAKKQENCATTMSLIRTKVSFAILRTALVCLKGARSRKGRGANVQENDLEIDKGLARFT